MGLLIQTSFETKEGLPVSSVYSYITGLSCDFRGYYIYVSVTQETYLSRERRAAGAAPIFVPTLEYRMTFKIPYTDVWGDMTVLYGKIKERLAEAGISATDVLEDPPQRPASPVAPPPPDLEFKTPPF